LFKTGDAGCAFPASFFKLINLERLIKLIDEGDPEVILAEESLVPKFNELLKYDLVVIKDDRVFLTEKGRLAKIHGIEHIIEQEKSPGKREKKIQVFRKGGKYLLTPVFRIKFGTVYIFSVVLLLILTYLYFYLLRAEI